LRPANCGFDVEGLSPRWAGQRLATVTLSFGGETRRGEITLTETGVEGGLVYALSAGLRDAIEAEGRTRPTLDLLPDWPVERVRAALSGPRRGRSGSTFLKKALPLGPAAMGVLVGLGPYPLPEEAHALARLVKALPLPLLRPRPIAEAISTAGGLCLDDLGEDLMLRQRPGCFAAGEMLDWEAPTGGYLLSGCFATGRAAALGAAHWVECHFCPV
jgi:predicted flavoprotein YhiN